MIMEMVFQSFVLFRSVQLGFIPNPSIRHFHQKVECSRIPINFIIKPTNRCDELRLKVFFVSKGLRIREIGGFFKNIYFLIYHARAEK